MVQIGTGNSKIPKIYAFDVDQTLELSRGPVQIDAIKVLRGQGHIVGLCGNWAVVTAQLVDWHKLFSFIGQLGVSKADFLTVLGKYIPAAEYIMVGNSARFGEYPDDESAAKEAGWRFIHAKDFAEGRR